ncbi:acrosin-like [Zalophus californianus]|uniref:Acrosin-like n=1 Tax=Zalophus californianus TaxID=9704 RepID=A0A6P9F9Q3_ZALCA|nr:acrosin-like [Zalophus californianus]
MVEMLPTAILLALAVSVVAKDNATCDAPCGLRFRQYPPGSGRIVGGQDATIGAWPWMVSLQVIMSHNNRRYHACGDTLLNSHWLLTAAHCFLSKKKVYDWRLIFGVREIVYGNNKPAKPPQQERDVEKIIIHEKYIPSLEHNDIALIKINPPVPCGQFIGTGCLPQFRAGPPGVPQACWVAGWGFLKEKEWEKLAAKSPVHNLTTDGSCGCWVAGCMQHQENLGIFRMGYGLWLYVGPGTPVATFWKWGIVP